MEILHFKDLGDTESVECSCSSARRVSNVNGNVPRGGGGGYQPSYKVALHVLGIDNFMPL